MFQKIVLKTFVDIGDCNNDSRLYKGLVSVLTASSYGERDEYMIEVTLVDSVEEAEMIVTDKVSFLKDIDPRKYYVFFLERMRDPSMVVSSENVRGFYLGNFLDNCRKFMKEILLTMIAK